MPETITLEIPAKDVRPNDEWRSGTDAYGTTRIGPMIVADKKLGRKYVNITFNGASSYESFDPDEQITVRRTQETAAEKREARVRYSEERIRGNVWSALAEFYGTYGDGITIEPSGPDGINLHWDTARKISNGLRAQGQAEMALQVWHLYNDHADQGPFDYTWVDAARAIRRRFNDTLLSEATRGESRSTSALANAFNAEVLAGQARFMDDLRYVIVLAEDE